MKITTFLASAAVALGLATGAMAEDKTKVGFVFVGPIGDGGWTYEHNKGREAVEAEFGDKVETVYVENVAEGPDAERVMTQMALDGADLIFTTSFGYMDATNNVAAVLVFPICLQTADALAVSAEPFIITLMIAASTSFATPIGYQTNLMVFNVGGYRFVDFLRVGLPLTLIVGTITVFWVPLLWQL